MVANKYNIGDRVRVEIHFLLSPTAVISAIILGILPNTATKAICYKVAFDQKEYYALTMCTNHVVEVDEADIIGLE